jgi:hypothetical protein
VNFLKKKRNDREENSPVREFSFLFLVILQRLLLLTLTLHFVRVRCENLGATSWHAPRSGGRRAPKGLIPFGFPQDLFLGRSFGGYQKTSLHLQSSRNKIQRFHISACAEMREFYSPSQHGRRASANIKLLPPAASRGDSFLIHSLSRYTHDRNVKPGLLPCSEREFLSLAFASAETIYLRATIRKALAFRGALRGSKGLAP